MDPPPRRNFAAPCDNRRDNRRLNSHILNNDHDLHLQNNRRQILSRPDPPSPPLHHRHPNRHTRPRTRTTSRHGNDQQNNDNNSGNTNTNTNIQPMNLNITSLDVPITTVPIPVPVPMAIQHHRHQSTSVTPTPTIELLLTASSSPSARTSHGGSTSGTSRSIHVPISLPPQMINTTEWNINVDVDVDVDVVDYLDVDVDVSTTSERQKQRQNYTDMERGRNGNININLDTNGGMDQISHEDGGEDESGGCGANHNNHEDDGDGNNNDTQEGVSVNSQTEEEEEEGRASTNSRGGGMEMEFNWKRLGLDLGTCTTDQMDTDKEHSHPSQDDGSDSSHDLDHGHDIGREQDRDRDHHEDPNREQERDEHQDEDQGCHRKTSCCTTPLASQKDKNKTSLPSKQIDQERGKSDGGGEDANDEHEDIDEHIEDDRNKNDKGDGNHNHDKNDDDDSNKNIIHRNADNHHREDIQVHEVNDDSDSDDDVIIVGVTQNSTASTISTSRTGDSYRASSPPPSYHHPHPCPYMQGRGHYDSYRHGHEYAPLRHGHNIPFSWMPNVTLGPPSTEAQMRNHGSHYDDDGSRTSTNSTTYAPQSRGSLDGTETTPTTTTAIVRRNRASACTFNGRGNGRNNGNTDMIDAEIDFDVNLLVQDSHQDINIAGGEGVNVDAGMNTADQSDELQFVNSLWHHAPEDLDAIGDEEDNDDDSDIDDHDVQNICRFLEWGDASVGAHIANRRDNDDHASLPTGGASMATVRNVPRSNSGSMRRTHTNAEINALDSSMLARGHLGHGERKKQSESKTTPQADTGRDSRPIASRFARPSTIPGETAGVASTQDNEGNNHEDNQKTAAMNNTTSALSRTTPTASSTSATTSIDHSGSFTSTSQAAPSRFSALHDRVDNISHQTRVQQSRSSRSSHQTDFTDASTSRPFSTEVITLLDDESNCSDDDEDETTPTAKATLPKRKRHRRSPSPDRKRSSAGDGVEDSIDENTAEDNDGSKNCCICLEEPSKKELSTLDGCDHLYCFSCIEKWSNRENTCPQCKARFTRIKRVYKIGESKKGDTGWKRERNVKKVKTRNQRSDYMNNLPWIGNPMPYGGMFSHLTALARIPFGPPPMNWLNDRRIANTRASAGSSTRELDIHDFAPPFTWPAFSRLNSDQSRPEHEHPPFFNRTMNPSSSSTSISGTGSAVVDRISSPTNGNRYFRIGSGAGIWSNNRASTSSTSHHGRTSYRRSSDFPPLPPLPNARPSGLSSHELEDRRIHRTFASPRNQNPIRMDVSSNAGTIENPLNIMDSDEE